MFLEISDLKKSFGSGDSRVEVLKGINLAVEQGEICVLLGPSGSGKSTLLNIIGGIDSADEGEIRIKGERMGSMKEKQLTMYRRKHLGYIFQMYNLIPNLTVRENVEVGAYLEQQPAGCGWSCCRRWDFMSTGTSCRTSCPAVSSSGRPLAGPL